jgi:hypothetical protein
MLDLGDIGVMECGQFKRIYNARNGDNELGIPALSPTHVMGPVTCLPIYHSAAFELHRFVIPLYVRQCWMLTTLLCLSSASKSSWTFSRSNEEGAVLITNATCVKETTLGATKIGDYIKRHFHAICEYQGIEDTKSGICFIVSMITSSDWAFNVQQSRITTPATERRENISFARHGPLEASATEFWGAWEGSIGSVGPHRAGIYHLRPSSCML